MPLVSFTSSKGGTGRTTASWLVCNELIARGQKVLYMPVGPRSEIYSFLADSNIERVSEPQELRRAFRETDLVFCRTLFSPLDGCVQTLAPWIREVRRVGGFLILDGFLDEPDDFTDIPLLSDLAVICLGPSRLDALYAKNYKRQIDEHAFTGPFSTLNARYLLCNTRGVLFPEGQEYLGLAKSEFMVTVIPNEPVLGDVVGQGELVDDNLRFPGMTRVKATAEKLTDEILELIKDIDTVAFAGRHQLFSGIEVALSAEEKKAMAKLAALS